MTDLLELTGMVIKSTDVSEYDKRLVILTRERGKITAFARGARRPKSQLIGGCRIFSFGTFFVYEGKDAYNLARTDIANYFTDIVNDIEATCYGCYFLELSDYYSRENIESSELLNLIYITLKALMNRKIPNRLIRCIFEMRMFVIAGIYPQMFECVCCSKENAEYFSAAKGGLLCDECRKKAADSSKIQTSTIYSMQYIITSKLEKLYTFVVKDEILIEMEFILRRYFSLYIDKQFKSLDILNTMV